MIELAAAGLTPTESKCYVELVKHTDIAPAKLSDTVAKIV